MLSQNFEFRKKVMDMHMGVGELIKYCYTCSRCTDNCPVSAVTDNAYNPRSNIFLSISGLKGLLDAAENIAVWGCTVCDTCDEVCPQSIELTEIFKLLKNESVKKGDAPEHYYLQAKAIFDSGKAIPPQPAIERRREQLGLPPVVVPDTNEVSTLLRNMGAASKLK